MRGRTQALIFFAAIVLFWTLTFPQIIPLHAEVGRSENWSGSYFAMTTYEQGTTYPEYYLQVVPDEVLNATGWSQVEALADFTKYYLRWGRGLDVYFHPAEIMMSRQGMCMEYAIMYSTWLWALGWENRICHDFTDHMWNQVLFNGTWVHVDSTMYAPHRYNARVYEVAWEKQFTFIYAFDKDGRFEDVTFTYTKKPWFPTIYWNRVARWILEFPYW